MIGDVILFLGKLCVSLSSAVFGFLMLDTHKYRSSHNKISSPLLPVLVCYLFFIIVIFIVEGLTSIHAEPSLWIPMVHNSIVTHPLVFEPRVCLHH